MDEPTARNGVTMVPETRISELRDAARLLGVANFAGEDDGSSGYGLRLAATLIGAAEAVAMVQASELAEDGERQGESAIEMLDRTAYRASGMRGPSPEVSEGLWPLWTIRRLQSQVGSLRRRRANADLAAVSSLLDAVHALLSGLVYGEQAETSQQDACRDVARGHIVQSSTLLSRPGRTHDS